MGSNELITKLFLQLFVILFTCRWITYIGKRFLGQTQVVCQMLAGIVLGPSLLGLVAPTCQAYLFPNTPLILANHTTVMHPSMSMLYALSQLGLVIYLFLIGLEFDMSPIRKRLINTYLVSLAGILTPLLLGILIAPIIYQIPDLFESNVPLLSAALFLGSAFSITAFPMLAHIIHEHQLMKTSFGALALSAGALDDAFVWLLLSAILAFLSQKPQMFIVTSLGLIVYILFFVYVGKHQLHQLFSNQKHQQQHLFYIFLILTGCAWFTNSIGIYALFGAFIAGLSMPKHRSFVIKIRNMLEPMTQHLLLPLFFVYAGLNTELSLINSYTLILATGLMIVIACLGKGVACTLAAKYAGETWKNSFLIGVLMNARGLMELIILNIGLEHHLITHTLFSMLVVMAIVTTFIASPLFRYLHSRALHEK